MDEEGHVRVGDEVVGLLRGRVGRHYDCWGRRVGRGGQVGVVHKADVGE